MSLEIDLRTYILADATVLGLVGANYFAVVMPKNQAMPAIVYQQISRTPLSDSHDGPGRVVEYRFQITSWATLSADARTLADAVRKRLNGASTTMTTTVVGRAVCESESDAYLDSSESEPARRAGKRQDWLIQHQETQP